MASETATIDANLPEKEVKAVGPLSAAEIKPAAEIEPQAKKLSLAPALWSDPDVRWLTGVHEAKGHAYFIREPYEELLWWLLMPSLLRLAGEAAPSRAAAKEMSQSVQEALAEAAAAGYRVDAMANREDIDEADEEESEGSEAQVGVLKKSGASAESGPETSTVSHSVKNKVKPEDM